MLAQASTLLLPSLLCLLSRACDDQFSCHGRVRLDGNLQLACGK